MSDASRRIFSVSEINQCSRDLLESQFAAIWVEGEISNLAMPASGHWYFTLKDDQAQLRCAMFRNRNFRVRRRPENGQQVMVLGGVSLYVARGEYQLIAERLEDAGSGRLQREFEALKARLSAEGLFDTSRKRPVPGSAAHVAIITSASGAAIHDLLTVFQRRYPSTRLSIFPSPVQGDGAARELQRQLELVNRHATTMDPPIEVVVLARGGGSLEDLWPFNDEQLARAIANSMLPVVSAVGHETDITIADLVADLRAPTPSAAGALLSPDGDTLRANLTRLAMSLRRAMQRGLLQSGARLTHMRRRLRHPASALREQVQRLDELDNRLQRSMQRNRQQLGLRLIAVQDRLARKRPEQALTALQQRVQSLVSRSLRAVLLAQARRQERLRAAVQLLHAVSPIATLGRGYAIVSDTRRQLVRDAAQVNTGDTISARLARGSLDCTVTARHEVDADS